MASYPCTDNPGEVLDAVVSAQDNADLFDAFVNGTDTQIVQLGTGAPTPSIRNTVRLIKSAAAEIDGADVSGKVVLSTGGTEYRMLGDRFSDFINVKDYGAKGDGVTDDTEAIKDAIDHAALGCLLFPQGVYCISDTLTMTGNGNGAYWFFGQSHLRWIGEEAGEDYASRESELPSTLTDNQRNAAIYNIENYGWAWYAKPMIYIAPASTGVWSRCVIEGGNFDGNDRASAAIKVHSYGALVHGVRIGHVKHCAISLCGAQPWAAGSGGVVVSDCEMSGAANNSASRLQHGLKNDIGIFVHDLDNNIHDSIVNFFGDAIVLRSSGNHICNCHMTVQFPRDSAGYVVDDNGTRVSEYPECANVVVDPDLGTSMSGSNWIANCYFNSGKYLVKGIKGPLMNTDINGGAYFLKSANVKVYGKDTTEAYLYGGTMAQPFHANGLTCHHPAYFQVYDYYPDYAISSTFMDTSIDINHNSNPSGVQLLDAGNIISQKCDDPMQICSATYPIAQGRYALIGAILYYFPNSSILRSGDLEYSFWHLNQSCIKGHLFFNGNTQKWQTKNAENVYGNFGDVEFFVDNQIHSATINGRTYKYSKFYCGSSSIDVDGITFGYMRSNDKFCRVYMFSMHNYSRMEYITSLPADYTSLLPSA